MYRCPAKKVTHWNSECDIIQQFQSNGGDKQNVILSSLNETIVHRYIEATCIHHPSWQD